MSNEAELLQKARAGDQEAGEDLFVRYLKESRSVAGLLRRTLTRPEDREDMLHEIYLQLIAGQNLFRGDSKLSTYVYQVARITIFQKYRRENTLKRGKVYRMIADQVDIPDHSSSPEYAYTQKQGRQILKDLISQLPSGYGEVLRLRVLEDLPYDEIARRLELPINTVSSKIHKGKKLLSEIFQARGITQVFDL